MVVQETKEENRMVSKNLTDVLNSAANHLCAVEVCDGFARSYQKHLDFICAT